jgi:DNA-directed RNA polymerase alpha subunit
VYEVTVDTLATLLLALEKTAADARMELLSAKQKAVASQLAISDLSLSVRARKTLQKLGTTTVAELIDISCNDIMATKCCGVTTLNEFREKLREHGLSLKGETAV